MKLRKASVSPPSGIGKDVLAGFLVDDRLVDVHRRARLALDGLGHEGRIGVVLQRRLADRALEHEHLVGELDRIAVAQVDLELAGALLVDQRVDLEALALGEMVDVVDQLVELVDAGDRIARAAADRPARASDRRHQRIVGVGILAHEVELDLRRHDRPQPALLIGGHDALQHVARREVDDASVLVDEVADDLRGRVFFPGHQRQRRQVRHQLEVAVILRIGEAVAVLGIAARDRRHEHGRRQRQRRVGGELLRRHHLAARHACLIGRDALDVLDAAPFQPVGHFLPVAHTAQVLDMGWRAGASRATGGSDFLLCRRHQSPKLGF